MIHEYKTGRSICGFIEFLSWVAIIIAAIALVVALTASSSSRGGALALAGLIPSAVVAFFGLICVLFVQMARAAMDGSVAAQKSVIQAQKHHEETLSAMRSYASRVASGDPAARPSLAEAAEAQADNASQPDEAVGEFSGRSKTTHPNQSQVIRYNGHNIMHDGSRFRVHGIGFDDLEKARAHINSIAVKVEPAKPAEDPSRLEPAKRPEPTKRLEPVVTVPKGLG